MQFAMPEAAICKENIVVRTFGAGIVFNGDRLVYPPEYPVQHLSVCFPLLTQPLLGTIAVLDEIWQECNLSENVCLGHLADLRR